MLRRVGLCIGLCIVGERGSIFIVCIVFRFCGKWIVFCGDLNVFLCECNWCWLERENCSCYGIMVVLYSNLKLVVIFFEGLWFGGLGE